MSNNPKNFFLGKAYDLDQGSMQDELIHYDPNDLTTHAVITGMTGSGKTGLGIIMLEEAALQGIPAIIVDPKGDLTNLLLHFPDLLPQDFKPWVDKDAARRDGVTVEQAAEKAASLWKNGLASYGIEKPRLEALKNAVEYAVYTPGSDSGLPVSILTSLSAPPIPWEGNREILREEISSTVTAILGLVGMRNIDPVTAKEHILLSNIFEAAWREGKDLDMATLIQHVQTPPFDKLGVFSLDQFYPDKSRFELAMLLNNFLAAPAFQTWLEGQPLDIGRLLYSSSGKPRHSVFYLAHLNDEERMFFVTLLYTAIETWMRTQKGSSGLRAMVYFDEIAGYLPPVANPPSKNIILRMLKQARAFGVGLVVATQNPVDLDYKALSNAGTWMIGRLQTERDKSRLLDGLEGAAPGVDRRTFDRLISLLDKRVFLLHNVHDSGHMVFHTRWAMNYLTGPITRAQIPAVNALVNAKLDEVTSLRPSVDEKQDVTIDKSLGQQVPPELPGSVTVSFYPANRGISDALQETRDILSGEPPQPKYVYRPELFGQARVAYIARKYNISHEAVYTVRINEIKRMGLIRWENFITDPIDFDTLSDSPLADASFTSLDDFAIESARQISDMENDYQDWIYRTQAMVIRLNPSLDVVVGPDVSEDEFRRLCEQAAEKKQEADIEAIKQKHQKQMESLKTKFEKEDARLAKLEQELGHRRMEEIGKGLENALGLVLGRRRTLTTSLTKRRMTSRAKADLEKAQQDVKKTEKAILDLAAQHGEELEQVDGKWQSTHDDIIDEPVSPFKKNIFMEKFGLLWLPYYAFQQEDEWVTVPAYVWSP
jgi:hypothetical protein